MGYAKPLTYFGADNSRPRLVAHGGLIGKLWTFTISKQDYSEVNTTLFNSIAVVDEATKSLIRTTYREMLPGLRPCSICVTIHTPLTASQAKAINDKNAKNISAVGNTAGTASGVVGSLTGPVTGTVVGMAVRSWTTSELLKIRRSWHEGDVIISIIAAVSGGIGQQQTRRLQVLSRDEYDPNLFRID